MTREEIQYLLDISKKPKYITLTMGIEGHKAFDKAIKKYMENQKIKIKKK